jgi:hypothetical protein
VGNIWLIDTNHDFKVDTKLTGTNMVGLPIVGDFDGDGKDDLGAWADNTFSLNLSTLGPIDGFADRTFGFGFASVRERPVAADFDGDNIDDLGLWVPDRAGAAPWEMAEWFLLISGGQSINARLAAGGGVINYTPTPFGNDLFAQFGDEWGLPVVGNFDPPVTPTLPYGSFTNTQDNVDVDNDGYITPHDALVVINRVNEGGDGELTPANNPTGSFVDVDGDGNCSPIDALLVINWLNSHPSGSQSGGEGESVDPYYEQLGSSSSSDDSLSALLALDDLDRRKK